MWLFFDSPATNEKLFPFNANSQSAFAKKTDQIPSIAIKTTQAYKFFIH
jgi:hypothetical protein